VADLFQSIKAIASLDSKIIVFFSTGKDSTVMLDLFQRFLPGRYQAVFLYFVKGLSFQESILRHYEDRFGIKIERRPHWDIANYDRAMANVQGRALKEKDIAAHIREETGLSWLAYGYRRDESMQRRGILTPFAPDYIDAKFRKVYPLGAWSNHHIDEYIKARKLLLPREYAFGFRNIDQFKGPAVLWIKNNYPEDWQKIIDRFPIVEAEALRQEVKNGY